MKLNQTIAIEKGVKSRTYGRVSELHKLNQKPDNISGFNKVWEKKAEADDDFPPESTKVKALTQEVIAEARQNWMEVFDVTATKDFGNTGASADVVVDGVVLLKGAPVPFLLFL